MVLNHFVKNVRLDIVLGICRLQAPSNEVERYGFYFSFPSTSNSNA